MNTLMKNVMVIIQKRIPISVSYLRHHLHIDSIQSPTTQLPVYYLPALNQKLDVFEKCTQFQIPLVMGTDCVQPSLSILDPGLSISRIIECPTTIPNANTEIKVRHGPISRWNPNMIRVRYRKMKKHKLKKRMRKNKIQYATKMLRKSIKKEKIFVARLWGMYNEAESFSAEEYVAKRLTQYNNIRQFCIDSGNTKE